MGKEYASVAELGQIPDRMYSRQEVATIVGCGWANVMESSKPKGPGKLPALKGELVTVGKVQQWMFSKAAILNWRAGIGQASTGLKVVVSLESEADVEELRALLKGTKFQF